ncbi:MAG: hypothetical protein JWP03_1433, partial [Phycisphaerales bacterium]|nr:hypothetical protein [Phycisphaerales bacterium]
MTKAKLMEKAFMKSRLTLIFAALVVLVSALIWVMRDRPASTLAPSMAAERTVVIRVKQTAEPAPSPTTLPAVTTLATPASQGKSSPMVHVDPSGEVKYVAREGDTVSQLAVALFGSDSRKHRDAVIAADASLQSDPDRVLTGQTYSLPPSSLQADGEANAGQRPAADGPVAAAGPKEEARGVKPTSADKANDRAAAVDGGPKLQYTAQRGDTVRGLAAGLLGGDTKANREGIIADNASLQRDPDHLVAG